MINDNGMAVIVMIVVRKFNKNKNRIIPFYHSKPKSYDKADPLFR